MYTGSYLQVEHEILKEVDDPCVQLWVLGDALKVGLSSFLELSEHKLSFANT